MENLNYFSTKKYLCFSKRDREICIKIITEILRLELRQILLRNKNNGLSR